MRRFLKRSMNFILAGFLMCGITINNTWAEDDFKGKEDYYYSLCTKDNLSKEETATCKAFMVYVSQSQGDLQDKIDRLDEELKKAQEQASQAAYDYSKAKEEVKALQEEIQVLKVEIDDLDAQIQALELQIQEKEDEVSALKERVSHRMEKEQRKMRLNQYIDFIMGSTSLEELIRRATGMDTLMEYDESVRVELRDLIESLNNDKVDLSIKKADLDVKKADLDVKLADALYKQYEAQRMKEYWEEKEQAYIEEGNQYAGDLQALQNQLNALGDKLGEIPASASWTKPIASGYRISANTWAYPSGSVHLGMDLAAPRETAIRAAGNGIVITSVDGCPTKSSGLGDMCGSAQGGTAGGGNQLIMLTRVDGTLYAVKYLHLAKGTPIAVGTQVNAGDYIGGVGSSGNSSGYHLHLEVYKLGTMSIQSYLKSWNGNLSFGCGWGKGALNKRCSVSGAPCRARPEEIFGY